MTTSPTTSPSTTTALANNPVNQDKDRAIVSDRKAPLTLSEGLILAIGSSSAYLLTFQYEMGFASYFGIPPQFVSVGLQNVLFGAALLAGFIMIIFGLGDIVVSFIPARYGEEPIFVRKAITVGVGLLGTFTIAYIYNKPRWWALCAGVTLLVVFAVFVLPAIRNRKETTYIEMLRADAKAKQSKASTPSLGRWFARRVGPSVAVTFWFGLLSVFMAVAAGDATAVQQKEFLVTTLASKELVLLRRYGDELIFAPFDRRTSEVQKSFIVMKVDALTTPLIVELVGPLKPVRVFSVSQSIPVTTPEQASPTPKQ